MMLMLSCEFSAFLLLLFDGKRLWLANVEANRYTGGDVVYKI